MLLQSAAFGPLLEFQINVTLGFRNKTGVHRKRNRTSIVSRLGLSEYSSCLSCRAALGQKSSSSIFELELLESLKHTFLCLFYAYLPANCSNR